MGLAWCRREGIGREGWHLSFAGTSVLESQRFKVMVDGCGFVLRDGVSLGEETVVNFGQCDDCRRPEVF